MNAYDVNAPRHPGLERMALEAVLQEMATEWSRTYSEEEQEHILLVHNRILDLERGAIRP